MDELDALWAFLVAAVIAFAATPPTARLARRLGVMHHPRERDLHERAVPGSAGWPSWWRSSLPRSSSSRAARRRAASWSARSQSR